jgi:hypothetical protein
MTAAVLAALLVLSGPQQPRDIGRAGGASISGAVVTDDATPRPIRHARVELTGERTLSVVTGDDGTFDFTGLPAGRYRLSASTLAMGPRGYRANPHALAPTVIVLAASQQFRGLPFVFRAGGVISGRVKDSTGAPIDRAIISAIVPASAASAVARVAAEAESDDEGNYRLFGLAPGSYILAVSPGSVASPEAGTSTFSATYFPGVESPEHAQLIDVAPREERAGQDFIMRRVNAGVIAGRLSDATGETVDATLQLSRVGPLDDGRSISTRGGTFALTVSPGTYTLRASRTRTDASGDTPRTVSDTAVETVVVAEGGRVDVPLTLHGPVTLSGQLTTSGPASTEPELSLTRDDEVISATIREDGRFVFAGLEPGTYQLRPTAGPAWLLESAQLGGRDALRAPIDVGAVPLTGMAVAVSSRAGRLQGRLSHANGAGAPELAVVIVNANRATWAAVHGQPIVVWPDTNGDWSAPTLAEGEYRVAALSDISATDLARVDFIESIVAAGAATQITAGHTATLDLRIQ